MRNFLKICILAFFSLVLLAVMALRAPDETKAMPLGFTETSTPQTLVTSVPTATNTPAPSSTPVNSPTASPSATATPTATLPSGYPTPTRQRPPATPEQLPVTGFGPDTLEVSSPVVEERENQELARLLIPQIHLDRQIVQVPILNDRWDISGLGTNIGRLEGTGRWPSDRRAMVLVGHVQMPGKISGPFAGLGLLRVGDRLIYQDEKHEFVYEVIGISLARPSEVSRLYVDHGDRLLLVTCVYWDEKAGAYAWRLIVEAGLVEIK